MNPYDWQSHNPTIEVPRSEADEISKTLGRGASVVVVGGRGMGKSNFLRQLGAVLAGPDVEVVVFPSPPPDLSVRACLDQLAHGLGVASGLINCREIVESYFARRGVPERLVLLFDEFDRYAEREGQSSAHPPGRGFFNELEIVRRELRQLGVLATGSIGVFAFRDVLGSSFLSRADHYWLEPFSRPAAVTLAGAFSDSDRVLPETVLDALLLASGGIPALLTYGYQRLWDLGRLPVERDVTEIFVRFERRNRGYLNDVRSSFSDPQLSPAPLRVWQRIQDGSGEVSRTELEDLCQAPEATLSLDLVDVLELLRAAGLVRIEGSLLADPIVARPIPSILNLPSAPPPVVDFRAQLARDLETLLVKLHRASADFFRSRPGGDKVLVPEAVFAAHLALGFELLGWSLEREAQSAAGRTDLKLRRNGAPEVGIVEVKIWGRNDYLEAHGQVESYWTAEVVAGAVVQLTDRQIGDWSETYRRRCLDPLPDLLVEPVATSDSPLQARFATTSETADGLEAVVDHFLLRLPRRR